MPSQLPLRQHQSDGSLSVLLWHSRERDLTARLSEPACGSEIKTVVSSLRMSPNSATTYAVNMFGMQRRTTGSVGLRESNTCGG